MDRVAHQALCITGLPGAELTQDFEVIDQKLRVRIAQCLIQRAFGEAGEKIGGVRQGVEKTKERTDPGTALELDPRAPVVGFERAGREMRQSIVMRDVAAAEGAGDQPGESARAAKDNADRRAVLLRKKADAELGDRFRLFRSIGTDNETVVRGRRGDAPHFRLGEQAVGRFPGRRRDRFGLPERFFPRADPRKIDV